MKALKLCLVTFAVAVFIAACSQAATTPIAVNTAATTNKQREIAPVQPAQPADELAAAKELYATNCMICHKDTGKGGKVTVEGKKLDPVDLTSDKMKNRTDEKLFKQIAEGVPDEGMPAFKPKLSDDEIKSLVKHMRVLQGK